MDAVETGQDIDCLIENIERMMRSCYSKTLNDTQCKKLLAVAREVTTALEPPRATILTIAKWPAGHAALRSALTLGLFEAFDHAPTKTALELAKQTGAEVLLLVRLMRALVGIGLVTEQSVERYSLNALSSTLLDPTWRTLITGMCSTTTELSQLPDFLGSIQFQNPSDPYNALFHYSHNTKLNMFQWLQNQPEQLLNFSAYMAASTMVEGTNVLNTYLSLLPSYTSFSSTTFSGERSPLLVDVGGGRGYVLDELCKQRPEFKGRIVVQDLPSVIVQRKGGDGVEAMAHDFFLPQPIKGADIYFFRHIFHDWPDSACHEILKHTIEAVSTSHSTIIIVDQVVPDLNASPFTAFMDISMMAFGGMERTESQWRNLLESVGLYIKRIESPHPESLSRDSVIEVLLEPK